MYTFLRKICTFVPVELFTRGNLWHYVLTVATASQKQNNPSLHVARTQKIVETAFKCRPVSAQVYPHAGTRTERRLEKRKIVSILLPTDGRASLPPSPFLPSPRKCGGYQVGRTWTVPYVLPGHGGGEQKD